MTEKTVTTNFLFNCGRSRGSLITQHASQSHNAPPFDGKEKSIKSWLRIKELDKLKHVFGLSDEASKTVSWASSENTVPSYLDRLFKDSPEDT